MPVVAVGASEQEAPGLPNAPDESEPKLAVPAGVVGGVGPVCRPVLVRGVARSTGRRNGECDHERRQHGDTTTAAALAPRGVQPSRLRGTAGASTGAPERIAPDIPVLPA